MKESVFTEVVEKSKKIMEEALKEFKDSKKKDLPFMVKKIKK